MSFNAENVAAQIDPLIAEVQPRIVDDELYGTYFDSQGHEARAMRTRMAAAIDRLSPPGSPYRQQAREINEAEKTDDIKVVWLMGVLKALHDDYAAGYTQSFVELVHEDLFADFLDMAVELQAKGFKDPAAVIAGSVLEEHLRKLAAKSAIAVEKSDGAPKKADALNAELAKAEAYTKLVQKSVTAWLDLRNQAAHGHYDAYDARQVAALIRDVRDFLVRYPA